MHAVWYYVEDDEVVGPATFDDLVRQIRRSNQSCLVWTDGMLDWTNSNEIPALSRYFRNEAHQARIAASDRTETQEQASSTKPGFLSRLRKELIEYSIIAIYLYVCIGSVLFYKATILHGNEFNFAPFGIAIFKALILGKFILILHALKLGERRGAISILLKIIKKSLLFAVFLIALTIAEELIVGYFHGRTYRQDLSELAGGTLPQAFASSILILLALVPYFAFREISDRLGEGVLWELLTARISSHR